MLNSWHLILTILTTWEKMRYKTFDDFQCLYIKKEQTLFTLTGKLMSNTPKALNKQISR